MTAATELTFAASPGGSPVSGLLLRPDGARLLYVLAHGAGAGMRHPFLESIAQGLAQRSIATLRYQFLYMERRARPPPPPPPAGPPPAGAGAAGAAPPARGAAARRGETESDVMDEWVEAILDWTGRMVH